MKFQNENIDQLTEELNTIKLKIAKINARRDAQIGLLKKNLDGRSLRNGTSFKSRYLYPNLYHDNSSFYRYPYLYPQYRSLENLSTSEPCYEKPPRKMVAFTSNRDIDSNLKFNLSSASMSNLLGKLKDFVFEQEKQLTHNLLNRIEQSRRAESPCNNTSCRSLKDRTTSSPFLNPVNKKDNFYKRYNTFAKRILKPLPTPSTCKNAYKPITYTRSWLNSKSSDYLYDKPCWTRWYHRFLTSPRYHHYLSDYNYYVPKLFTLPPDIESIVEGRTKSFDHAYNCQSHTSGMKSYPDKYDPFESDSYIKPRLPNWKQYYYTHKLKSKPSKESYLQYYDPHYDFFPDAASVDSTDELLETSSTVEELPENPEQLINDYRDAIYEDVIQNLRTKQQRPSYTLPRHKPSRIGKSLSPTFSLKCSKVEDNFGPRNMKLYSNASSSSPIKLPCINNANRAFLSSTDGPKKYDSKNEFTTELLESVQPVTTYFNDRPLYSQSSVKNMTRDGTQNSEYSQHQTKQLSPTRITAEVLGALKCDTVTTTCTKQIKENDEQQSNLQIQNIGLGKMPEKIQSDPLQKSTVFSEKMKKYDSTVNDDFYKPLYQPPFTVYEQQYENTVNPSDPIAQSSSYNNKLKDAAPIPSRMITTGSLENTKHSEVIADPNINILGSLYAEQSTVGYPEQLDEHMKSLSNIAIRNLRDGNEPHNENLGARISQETARSKKIHPTQLSFKQEKRSPLLNSNETLQLDPNSTITTKNVTPTLQRSNSGSRPALSQRDSLQMPNIIPQQLSHNQMSRTESTPLTDNFHHATEIADYAHYSNPDQIINYPELFDSINSKPTSLQRGSSQLILRHPPSEQQNISMGSAEQMFDTTSSSIPTPLRRRSSQLIGPQVLEKMKFSNSIPTKHFDSTNSRSAPLRRRRSSQQLIAPSLPLEQENNTAIHRPTTTEQFDSVNSRSAPLRRQSSQLIIAPPALEQGNISHSLAGFSQRETDIELVQNSSDPSRRMTVPAFRRQSSKLTPAYSVLEQDSEIVRKLSADQHSHLNTDQLVEYSKNNIYQNDELRDPDDSYKNTDFSQPIYEQPREEHNIDYYYDNNYPPSLYEVDQRYDGDDLHQSIDNTAPHDEIHGIYDSYGQPHYHQEDYHGQSNENYPVTAYYDPNAKPDTYSTQGQNYENYQNVKYSVEEDPQTYEAYNSDTVGNNDNYYAQNVFPGQYTANENNNAALTTTVETTNNEPSNKLEDRELTSSLEFQPSENRGTKNKPTETLQTEEPTSTGNKMNSAQNHKKSAENTSEIRNRESISRRASKISLQSSADDRRFKVQPPATGEPQKRAPKIKQVENNKLKRTASTVSRTKMPSSKRA